MVYLNTIPNAPDFLSVSQPQIKENFAQLETQFSIDHDSLLAGHATGKHLKLTMPKQSSDPSTAANEVVLYSKEYESNVELFYREQSDGAVRQLTYSPQPYIRAFGHFDKTGAVIGTAYNIASVIYTSSFHQFKITFTTPLSNSDYTVLATGNYSILRDTAVTCQIVERNAAYFVITKGGDDGPSGLAGMDVLVLKV